MVIIYFLRSNYSVSAENMSRPSDAEFFEWSKNDSNILKIENAVWIHPDLINIKNKVIN